MIRRAERTTLSRTAKPRGPGARSWRQVLWWCACPTGQAASAIRKATVATKLASPGRPRHKPSTHCAGKAGCRRLYLYARVRFLLRNVHTRPRVQRAPGLPCALGPKRARNSSKPRAQHAARTRSHICSLEISVVEVSIRRCARPVIARSDSDEAIRTFSAEAFWIASLRSQ